MDSNKIAAIDFGTAFTKVLLAEKCENGINILGFSKVKSQGGVKRGDVVNIQKALDSLNAAIDEIQDQCQVRIDEAIVSIDGRLSGCETLKVPKRRDSQSALITEKEIEGLTSEVIHGEVKEGNVILNVIPQKYDVDDMLGYSRNDIVGMSGKSICGFYKVFYGKNSYMRNIKDVLSRAGITSKAILLSPIAAAYSALTNEEKDLGVALLDIGAGTTDLLLIKDNIIRHASVIPFAGNSVTDDIHICTGAPVNLTEIMKVKYGCCMESTVNENKVIVVKGCAGREDKEITLKNLSHVIEARMTEIFEAVAYEVEQSGLQGKLPGGLVITGGSCYMERIQDLANALLGCNVRLAAPDQLTVHTNKFEDVYSPSSAVVVGLANYFFDNRSRIEQSIIIENEEEALPKKATNLFGEEIEEEESLKGTAAKKPIVAKKPAPAKRNAAEEKPKEKVTLGTIFNTFFTSDNNEA